MTMTAAATSPATRPHGITPCTAKHAAAPTCGSGQARGTGEIQVGAVVPSTYHPVRSSEACRHEGPTGGRVPGYAEHVMLLLAVPIYVKGPKL